MKIKGELTISRPSYGDDREFIEIELRDKNSMTNFARVYISYGDFTRAITGQGFLEVDIDVRNLEYVGLKKVKKELIFIIPEDNKWTYEKDYAIKNAQIFADIGWRAETYFSSQNSFFTNKDDEKRYARTTQYQYIKEE